MMPRWSVRFNLVENPYDATHVAWTSQMEPQALPCAYPRTLNLLWLREKSNPIGKFTTELEIQKAILSVVYIEGSQKKAAAKLGVSPQYLSDIINGKREISDKIAAHFGVRRSRLFVPIGAEVA